MREKSWILREKRVYLQKEKGIKGQMFGTVKKDERCQRLLIKGSLGKPIRKHFKEQVGEEIRFPQVK